MNLFPRLVLSAFLLQFAALNSLWADAADPGDDVSTGAVTLPVPNVTPRVIPRTLGAGDLADFFRVFLTNGSGYNFGFNGVTFPLSINNHPHLAINAPSGAVVLSAAFHTDGAGFNFVATETGFHVVRAAPFSNPSSQFNYSLSYSLTSGAGGGSTPPPAPTIPVIVGTPVFDPTLPTIMFDTMTFTAKGGRASVSGTASVGTGVPTNTIEKFEIRTRTLKQAGWSSWRSISPAPSILASASFSTNLKISSSPTIIQVRAFDTEGNISIPATTLVR